MPEYKFNNAGLDLLDLLTFSLAIPFGQRHVFIENLGRDLENLYYKSQHRSLADGLYINISHNDNGQKSYKQLKTLLRGRDVRNGYGENIADLSAIYDMRQILIMLNNPNDKSGQEFLFGILNKWKEIPPMERNGFEKRFSDVCKSFLLDGKSFRINDPKMKKDLMFMIADNADWMDKFRWYSEMLNQNDLSFSAQEMQSLYDKMLESKAGFEQYYEQKAVSEYRDADKGKAKQYAEDVLKKAKESLDMVVAREQNKTPEIKQEQQSYLEQPVKKESEPSIKVTKVMTYDDLMKENESLRRQVEYWKSLYKIQQKQHSQQTAPVMQKNSNEYNM